MALVPRLDQVAHRDDVAADAAADRRGDLRVLQVQLARRHHGLVGRNVGEIDAPSRGGLIQVRLCRRPSASEPEIPLVLRLVIRQLRLVLGDLRLRLVEQRLIRPRVEFKEDVPLLDQRPFLEVDLVQVAPDVRPHLDGIDRGRPARVVRGVGDVPLDGVTDRDWGRRRRGRLRRRVCAAGHGETQPEDQGGGFHGALTFLPKKSGGFPGSTS